MIRAAQQLYRPACLFPAALILGAIVTWPYLPRWAPDLTHDPLYQFQADQLRLPPGHRWVPRDMAQRVVSRVAAAGEADAPPRSTEAAAVATSSHGEPPPKGLSLLQPGLPERIAAALSSEPWVAEVREVQQHRDGTVSVDLEWRRPSLMVSTPRGMYAVDAHGVLLPPEDFTAADIPEFPIVRGITSWPSVGAGELWDDPLVQGAARLSAILAPRGADDDPWRRFGLAYMLAPAAGSPGATAEGLDGAYQLVTRGGSHIIWGRPPGPDTLEPTPEQKIARLTYYLEQCGRFETSQGPSRINIRETDAIYAGALTSPQR